VQLHAGGVARLLDLVGLDLNVAPFDVPLEATRGPASKLRLVAGDGGRARFEEDVLLGRLRL